MAGPPTRHEQYTVAVVFAMEFEMTAFRYMLDEEYKDTLSQQREDQNRYILGRLGRHHVVLAFLPGEQGIGAAATVGKDLSRTFPAIRWRLLVGIGGGVPSDLHDIRLGDVVVSMPDTGSAHGGVVQYDLGKDQDGGFRRKGFLAQPPPALRNTALLMKSNHMVEDNSIEKFVEAMLQRSAKLRKKYQCPEEEVDILYRGDKLVKRLPRDTESPEIHYGLIASGNRVVVSLEDRRKIIASIDGDVLCFEMEAAGFAASDPCLVIRGISDYADPHKNRNWQHWATANAAACAKEILLLVKPEDLGAEVDDTGSGKYPVPGYQQATSDASPYSQNYGVHVGSGTVNMRDINNTFGSSGHRH